MTDRMAVQFAAQAAAMNARSGSLTGHLVEDLRVKAEELLPKGDTLRGAVINFATMFELYHRDTDPAPLRYAGEALERAVAEDMNLARPVRRERRDIDG